MTRLSVLLSAAALTMVLGCLPASASPRIEPAKCRVTVAQVRLTCGTLVTALDRSTTPSSGEIRLDYVVLKSDAAVAKPDPVVFLTGGPGSSALYFLNALAKSPLRKDRDIIAIEQRGNGYSQPNLLCNVDVDPKSAQTSGAAQVLRDCHAQIVKRGTPLQPFNITESSTDLEDLRKAMGIARWNVAGTSFGTFWASRYAALYPAGIRSLLLDSPYPLQADPDDSWQAHLSGLDAVFTACDADAACKSAYPDLRARFVSTVEALAGAPAQVGKAKFTGNDVFQLVNGVNFETASVALVPRLIDAVLRSDFKTVEKIAALDPYGTPKGFDMRKAYSLGLSVTMHCIDDGLLSPASKANSPATQGNWPAALVTAAKSIDPDRTGACRSFWSVKPADTALNEPVSHAIPTLIVAGAMDPETPPSLGQEMARTLSKATLAVLPDSAHAALSVPSACASRVVTGFLNQPDAQPDLACLARDLPRFSLPGQPIVPTAAGR